MKQQYAFEGFEKETMARALGKDLSISTKFSVMVGNAIRGKSVERARTILKNVIVQKEAIKFTRFNFDRGHQKKLGPAKFPVETCRGILMIVKNAELNAYQKNLEKLHILHACAHKASGPWHYGRHRGRRMKRTHIEIVVGQQEKEKKEPKEKKK